MRWKFSPSSYLKTLAISISIFSMCIAPVAQGAQAASQREMINQYLKDSGLTTKKITTSEFWNSIRHEFPQDVQRDVDELVKEDRNGLMPKFEATSFKDKNGIENVRITISQAGQSVNLTLSNDAEKRLKYNSVSFKESEIDIQNLHKFLDKIAQEDPVIKNLSLKNLKSLIGTRVTLTLPEFKKLSFEQKAEYLYKMRLAAEAGQKVYTAYFGSTALNDLQERHKWAYEFLFGEEAFAAQPNTGDNCIVAGYFTKYGENGRCGGSESGWSDIQGQMNAHKSTCSSSQVACNPLVYGYKPDGGGGYGIHCVPREPREFINRATHHCNEASPLRNSGDPTENKKRIIESYMRVMHGKKIDLKIVKNAQGEDAVAPDQYSKIADYLNNLNGYIQTAAQKCSQSPLSEIQATRGDQINACEDLQTRAMDIQAFIKNSGGGGAVDCSLIAGSVESKGKCKCPRGTSMKTKTANGVKTKSCEKGGGFNWLLVAGVGLGLLGIILLLKKGGNGGKSGVKKPTPVPPEPPPTNPTPTIGPTTSPTIDPPPRPTCPAPNILINGVCTPPVVTPSEGGSGSGPGGGGTR